MIKGGNFWMVKGEIIKIMKNFFLIVKKEKKKRCKKSGKGNGSRIILENM